MELDEKSRIRSFESCRTDLLKWGARVDKNSNRPYFEGHERQDVVQARKRFINFFMDRKDLYHYPFYSEDGKLTWNIPTRNVRILLSHDESTYKSSKILYKKGLKI